MNEVRLGVIGCGFMGQLHMKNFPTMPRMKFTAASDNAPAKLDAVVQQYKVQGFADGNDLINSGLVDAVLIATPHYHHPIYSIAAFKAGLHVLTEKPVAVTAKAAAEVNAEHRKHKKLVFGAMFQYRNYPVWRKMKELVASGQIGEIQRVSWTITNWFRSQAYYDSGGWRATWGGEGGGVLLNQCPHNLDLFQWIVGMPSKVTAFISLGKYHHIEVEDEVTAYLEYPNKATGVFTTSTGEAPGVNRFEIAGDRGLLVSDSSRKIDFTRTEMSVTRHRMTTRESFPRTPVSKVTIEVADHDPAGHKDILENFIAAILDGKELVAPAEEGLASVELANAMIQSGVTGKPVNVPTERNAYDRLIHKLIKESKFKKGAAKKSKVDMAASFNKA